MEAAKTILKKALKEVKSDYFNINERGFTYELYRHAKSIKHDFNFVFSPELTKRVLIPKILMDNTFFKSNFFYDMRRTTGLFTRTPDFMFHNPENIKHQLYAMEVKPINTAAGLLRQDLSKLMFYVKSSLDFNQAILILYGDGMMSRREIPNINEVLKDFPEIEIWVVRPQETPIIYCSTNQFNLP